MNNDIDKKILILITTASFCILFFLFFLFFNKGSLEIKSNPSGAKVFIDDKERGETPTVIKGLKPGEHSIKIKKDNFAEIKTTPNVKRGKNDLNLTLYPSAIKDPPSAEFKRLVLNQKFEINYKKDENNNIKYEIFLFAVYNRPIDYDSWIQQLKQYKKESLEWLRSHKIEFETNQIEWVPPKAKDL